MLIKTADIIVGDRQRKGEKESGSLSAEKVNELAISFQKHGQLQPIVVTLDNQGVEHSDWVLVAGFNRLTAARLLGWEKIEAVDIGAVTPLQAKEMELEENIRRTELEWWERAAATAEIHDMKVEQDSDWTMQKTADMVGISKSQVSMAKDLVGAMEEDPSLKGEETLRGALRKRKVDRGIEKRKKEISLRGAIIRALIYEGDANKLIKQEPDERFDTIVTNLPFGVDLKLKGGETPYFDEEEYIIGLVQEIVKESYRILKPDSWMVAWFDIRKITYNNSLLRAYKEANTAGKAALFDGMGLTFWMQAAGFNYVTLVPSIWAKPNKTQGLIGDPHKGLITGYEAMVFASKGDAILHKRGRSNLFIFDTPPASEKVHPLQMPTDLCEEILSMVCLRGSRILDPFAGSGAIGLAALNRGCEFVGYELDPDKASNGNLRLQEWQSASV